MDEKAEMTIWTRQAKDKQEILEQLKKMPIIEIACKKSNIGRSTFYRWCQEDKEFKKAADEAMKEGESYICDMSESQLVSMIMDKKFPAIQLWLKTHHPKYTNRLEISGELTAREEDELSPEQQEVVRQALKFAGYKSNVRRKQTKQ